MRRKHLSAFLLALGMLSTVILAIPGLTGAEESTSSQAVLDGPDVSDEAVLSTAAKPTYTLDRTKLPFDALAAAVSQRAWGVLHGAGWRAEVPEDWNGELVMWAHGFAGYGPELNVDNPPFRAWLLANHFAWAASSYSQNGYVVEQGARDTFALAREFGRRYGKPVQTYMTGASMGGHITGYSIERYPNAYDGAMPVCGVLGDRELFDFFTDFHLVTQTVTGISATYPFGPTYPLETVPKLKAALGTPSTPAYQQVAAVVQQRTGGTRPGFGVAFASWLDFLLSLGAPPPGVAAFPATNKGTVYQLDGDPAISPAEESLNAAVPRVSRTEYPTPDGLWTIGKIRGRFTIPVLTMHTIGDLFVPFSMEQSYARKAAANGNDGQLVQRAIRDVGHCGFSEAEFNTAMRDLVNWVRNGVKPLGDTVTDSASVAAPTYGCRFTDTNGTFKGTPARPLFAACPTAVPSGAPTS